MRRAPSTEQPSVVARPKLSRRLWLAITLGVAVGCLSPTLPLPPPDRPNIEGPDASGNVTLSGSVLPGANVYADNLVTHVSVGQQASPQSGYYRLKITAQIGDDMDLFYQDGTEISGRTTFTIPNPIRLSNLADGGGAIYANPGADAGP
jgi:hypothetical protein